MRLPGRQHGTGRQHAARLNHRAIHDNGAHANKSAIMPISQA
jgi:hypothetical protein